MWAAVTEPGELEAWMGHPVEIDLRLGGAIRFRFAADDIVACVLVALDPLQRLAFTFGDLSVVEWTMEPTEHGCRYRMSHHGLPPDADTAGKAAGWHDFLLRLDMYLSAGRAVDTDEATRLTPVYAALLQEART